MWTFTAIQFLYKFEIAFLFSVYLSEGFPNQLNSVFIRFADLKILSRIACFLWFFDASNCMDFRVTEIIGVETVHLCVYVTYTKSVLECIQEAMNEIEFIFFGSLASLSLQ